MIEYFKTDLGTLYCGDALEVLPTLPDNGFKLIFADYPFKIKGGRKAYFKFLEHTAKEFYRLISDDGWLIVINNPSNLFRLAPYLQDFEFRNEVALIRRHAFCPPGMFCFKHNALWVLSKRKQKLKLPPKTPDVMEYQNSYRAQGMHHPEAIPKWLAELVITATTEEGDKILDPFAGSGTALIVAEELGRRWIGIEVNEDYCAIIRSRFEMELAKNKIKGEHHI